MTSYVMCNKKKLGIKKSDNELLKKSVEDRKVEYFKSELLKILDKKEKEENGEEVSKSFIVQELYKSMTDPLYMAKGGKVGTVGEIRTWKDGHKYKKMPNKKWVRIYDKNDDDSTKTSIARLKGKVRRAQSVEELFQIVLNNTHRFSDENGKPLDIVLELKKEVENKRNDLAINKELKKPYSKADAVKTIKEWATQDNYDKAKGKTREEIFFNFGQKLKVIGKIPDKYLKILNPASGDTRVFCGKGYFIDHMVNHHASVPVEDYEIIPDVLENPDKVKIDDSKGVPTLIFQKKTDKYGTVVVNCKTKGDKVIFYKTGFTGNKESYKNKPPVVDRNPTINPSSVGGNGNVSALPDGNSNIAQDYNGVNKKIKIDTKDFPEQFNKGKWKKQTKILLDFVNATNGDSVVKSLYKKLGALKNDLPFKISKPKKGFGNGAFSLSCERATMKPAEQTLQILEISDENEDLKKDTCMKALHEIMHMIDFSCRDNKNSPDYASNSNEQLINAINNSKVSDEEIESLEKHFAGFRAEERKIIDKLNSKAREIRALGESYKRGEITTYSEYGEKYKVVQAEWEAERKKIENLRAKEVEVSQYADILDALSGGDLHDNKGFGGHGRAYYRKESNKANEIVANYAALLTVGSEYADKLKKNYPELADSVYNLYKQFLER